MHLLQGLEVVCIPSVLQINYALVQLIIRLLAEGLVRRFRTVLICIHNIHVIGIIHHFCCIWLLDIDRRCRWRFRLLCVREAAHSTHATLEADIVHLVHRLAGVRHDPEVAIFVHRAYLSFEAVHEI